MKDIKSLERIMFKITVVSTLITAFGLGFISDNFKK